MLRLDTSLTEDLLRESPASRKLKFLNGSSRQVNGECARSRSMNTRFSSFIGFVSTFVPMSIPQRAHRDPVDRPPIPAVHWNPFSRGIVRDLYPWRYRRLRACFRPISCRGTGTLARSRVEKVKTRFNGYLCAAHLRGRYKFESRSYARIGRSEKWAIARKIDLQ